MSAMKSLTAAQKARAALKSAPERVSSLHKPDIEKEIEAADAHGLRAIDADLADAGWTAAGNMRQSIADRLKALQGKPTRHR